MRGSILAAAVLVLAACGSAADQPTPPADPEALDAPAETEPAPDGDDHDEDDPDEAGREPEDLPADDPAGTEPDEVAEAAVEALDFRSHTLAGDDFHGREVAGSHVVLWMWAPW